MKKVLRLLVTFILCITVLLTFIACSSGNSGSSQNEAQASAGKEVEPLDLTGNWAQKGKEGDDSYMAGYIKDGIIEIFWVSDGGKSGDLYWSGSYIAPTESTDNYSWDSVNDKIKTDYALLASGDDTKTFSYENGEISYSVSMLGQTTTVSLVPSELDYSTFKPAGGSSGAAQDGQQVVLENSSYSAVTSNEYCTIYYAVTIHNPNEEYAVQYPTIQITARSEDDAILTTEEQTLSAIAANDTIVYANEIFYEGKAPAKVDITVENDDSNYMHQEGSEVVRQDELAVSNVSENIGEYDVKYTGEVTNNSTIDQDSLSVIVVFKKGDEALGGICTYVENVKSGETKPFEVSGGDIPEHDSYEIYALQW